MLIMLMIMLSIIYFWKCIFCCCYSRAAHLNDHHGKMLMPQQIKKPQIPRAKIHFPNRHYIAVENSKHFFVVFHLIFFSVYFFVVSHFHSFAIFHSIIRFWKIIKQIFLHTLFRKINRKGTVCLNSNR